MGEVRHRRREGPGPVRRVSPVIPILFDDTALIALFDWNPQVKRTWEHAEAEDIPVLYPAAAIHQANLRVRATDGAWAVLLDRPNGKVLALTREVALAASRHSDDLALGQSIVEASLAGAIVVTARPLEYPAVVRTEQVFGF